MKINSGEIKRKREILLDIFQTEKIEKKLTALKKELGITKKGLKKTSTWGKYSNYYKIGNLNKGSELALKISRIAKKKSQGTINYSMCCRALEEYIIEGDMSDFSLQSNVLIEILPEKENVGDFWYDQNQEKDSEGKNVFIGNSSVISNKNLDFPFRIYFNHLTRERDIKDFLTKNWKIIEQYQKEFGEKIRIREKTRRKTYDIIYKNKDKPHKKISELIDRQYADTSISKIKKIMKKRKTDNN